ncbi:hypothetical protein [Escherichia coli]|uniref:hypothetical protein n=1 Tax=Escherichia coli TaxID=562 RepID=UPI002AA2A1CA|nr:hypothetical protein [Escherichia coli]
MPGTVREATGTSGVDMQPPRLADTAERDYFILKTIDDNAEQVGGTISALSVLSRLLLSGG